MESTRAAGAWFVIWVLIVGLVGLLPAGAQVTNTNDPAFWEQEGYGTCDKIEPIPENTYSWTLGSPPSGSTWTLLILKSATDDLLIPDPQPGVEYTVENERSISHVIRCWDESTTTTTTATSTTSSTTTTASTTSTTSTSTTTTSTTTTTSSTTTTETTTPPPSTTTTERDRETTTTTDPTTTTSTSTSTTSTPTTTPSTTSVLPTTTTLPKTGVEAFAWLAAAIILIVGGITMRRARR